MKIPTFLGLTNSTVKDEEYEFLKMQDKKLHSSPNCNPYHYQCKGFLLLDMNHDRLKNIIRLKKSNKGLIHLTRKEHVKNIFFELCAMKMEHMVKGGIILFLLKGIDKK